MLHLFPGVLIAVLSAVLSPLAIKWGYPPLLGLLVAATLGMAFQLGHLLHAGRKRNGRWSLDGVVLYRATIPLGRLIALVLGLTVIAIGVLILTSPLDLLLQQKVFWWLPSWYLYGNPRTYQGYSRAAVLFVLWLRLGLDGLLYPTVEELYFRGYLMPRLDRFGPWTPALNHTLFTLYHLWQPQNYPTLLLGIFPMVWAAWRWRSLRISLGTHLLLNLISGILAFGLILGKAP